jgi:hypothetical protein
MTSSPTSLRWPRLAQARHARPDASTPSRQTHAAYFVLSQVGVSRPVTDTCSRPMRQTTYWWPINETFTTMWT